MKLIRHMIPVDIGNNQKLIVNSLNGLIDRMEASTFEILAKWQKCKVIVPENDLEAELYNVLQSRGYLVKSYEEEIAKKNRMVKFLRDKHAEVKQKPNRITFVMTYNCNFRCPYCFEEGRVVKKEVITPELIDAALKLVGDDLETVGLFGGEPLLPSTRPALEYLISQVPDKAFSITTNGYYLVEFFDLLSTIKISEIMVTLDGEEDAHNKRRYLANGAPTFQKIMQGIQKYLENNIPVCIRMNIDKGNYDKANNLKAHLLEKFAEHGELLSFETSPMMRMDRAERNDILEKLYSEDIDFSHDGRQQRNRFMGRFNPMVNALTGVAKPRPTYSFCYAHMNSYLVDPFGLIYPCLLSVGVEELAIGTYYPEINFKENGINSRNIETIPECRECIYSLLCGGGCPLRLPQYDDLMRPVCFNVSNQIHNILPKFYLAEQCKNQALRKLSIRAKE